MGSWRNRWCAIVLAVVAAWPCASLGAQRQDDAADAARLVEVLELKLGSIVADIGAASGQLTLRLASEVGPTGRVYGTDINPQRLREMKEAVERERLQQVTVLEGGSVQTNLPVACCDAVFMRHVYHHVGGPPEMNASLFASLKPGGRVAIIDFAPDSGQSAPAGRRDQGAAHGVTPETVVEELKAAGFIDVRQLPWSSRGYYLVLGRRPL